MPFQPFDLSGKVALVTGGNSGLGLGMAQGLAQAGADVVIWGTNEDRNRAARAQLEAYGTRVRAERVDVTREADVEHAFGAAVAAMGRVDAVFANAGVSGKIHPFVEYSDQEFRDVFAVNVDGVVFTLRAACRHMIARAEAGDAGGSLIGISSIGAIHGSGRTSAYGASKGAVASLMRAIAVEHARYGIRANCIHPGWATSAMSAVTVDDPRYQQVIRRVPLRRYGKAEEFGGIAVYLASDASSFHTGDSIVIDGGYTIF